MAKNCLFVCVLRIFLGTNDHLLEEWYLLGLLIDPSDHCGPNVVVVLVFEYINIFGGFDILWQFIPRVYNSITKAIPSQF